jgi:hypothetical protein
MVYTKATLDPGMIEFDISSKKYKTVSAVERADKNYFIVLTPTKASLADNAIEYLNSAKQE